MKGMVFSMFAEHVEQSLGLDFWQDIIDATEPASEAIYVAGDIYDDAELIAFLQEINHRTGQPIPDLLRGFGAFLLGRFAQIHPEFFAGHTTRSFLKSVHGVIHSEVRKLHDGVELPAFYYDDLDTGELIMRYESPRKMCHLAEGLITAAADHFGARLQTDHAICMHDGHDHCVLKLAIEEVDNTVAA